MPLDRYSKAVLTVIAISLSVIAWRGFVAPTPARAFGGEGCGASRRDPCYIELVPNVLNPFEVEVKNWPDK